MILSTLIGNVSFYWFLFSAEAVYFRKCLICLLLILMFLFSLCVCVYVYTCVCMSITSRVMDSCNIFLLLSCISFTIFSLTFHSSKHSHIPLPTLLQIHDLFFNQFLLYAYMHLYTYIHTYTNTDLLAHKMLPIYVFIVDFWALSNKLLCTFQIY